MDLKGLQEWAPARHTTIPFPAYAYVPGHQPHPRRSPQGHSHGKPHPNEDPCDLEGVVEDPRWLYAVDLYNGGFLWESHEYWEALWHACGRKGPEALLLKALIQTAAAHLKAVDSQWTGVEILAGKSDGMFAELIGEGRYRMFGLDLETFLVRRNIWFSELLAGKTPSLGLFPFVQLESSSGS